MCKTKKLKVEWVHTPNSMLYYHVFEEEYDWCTMWPCGSYHERFGRESLFMVLLFRPEETKEALSMPQNCIQN